MPPFGKPPVFRSPDEAKNYMTKPAPGPRMGGMGEGGGMEGEDCASEVQELVTKYGLDAVQGCLDGMHDQAAAPAPEEPGTPA